jgi:hypothetical protein
MARLKGFEPAGRRPQGAPQKGLAPSESPPKLRGILPPPPLWVRGSSCLRFHLLVLNYASG